MIPEHEFQQDIDNVASISAVPTILSIVCRTTGMRFAAVARVTSERWVTCSAKDDIQFGLTPGDELDVQTTICHEIRQSGKAVVIDHVAQDAVFCGHPTPAQYGFQSYISVPIRLGDGSFFGTLCAIDPEPHALSTPDTIEMFEMFAQVIGSQLDTASNLQKAQRGLHEERETSQLREQFIAILGHDIRTPLSALMNGIEVLNRAPSAEQSAKMLAAMGRSAVRIIGLVDNLMDFAKGRLGGGITLNRKAVALAPVIEQVVQELQLIDTSQRVLINIHLGQSINCDAQRIAQLVSNLLSNAFFHGDKRQPVELRAELVEDNLKICITNSGTPIPKRQLKTIFEPYNRGTTDTKLQGLGLGLHIANEISRAHGGRLDVISDDQKTRFTFQMPIHTVDT